jgi:hypothetical protein
VLWDLLTDLDQWPAWGPSVEGATLHGETLELGTSGTVSTVVGVGVPFEITDFEPGRRWGWKVAGLPATVHTVEDLGNDRCRVGFGVPWLAAPYVVICEIALKRLETMANKREEEI